MSTPANSANTLSLAFSPGQDIRFANTSSESIFTYGDYRIERSIETDSITGTGQNLSFTPFSTLENMGIEDFNLNFYTSIQNNELRPVKTDPSSYVYFGSFYTEVARSINNIIDNFPYAALAFDNFNSVTIFNYSEDFNTTTKEKTSSFRIPTQVIINEGYILFNSGSPIGNQISILSDTNKFEIQMSGSTSAETPSFQIKSYSFVSGAIPYLEFQINGHLFEGAPIPITGTSSTAPVYIRPSRKRMTEYIISQTRLERQLLGEGLFDIPDVDDVREEFRFKVKWPRVIDGFNPDNRGEEFEQYKNNILLLAGNVDDGKTDIMIKTMIPDNLLDFDTKTQIYKKITSSYAKQFDEIKNFIDNIAYAHSLNYSNEESVPEKFLIKLSNLLGWKLSSNFKNIDLFEYLSSDENPENNSFSYYNIEMWKRILININWLYKRKGTRDALQFIFRLMGAPECLIVFNEFVYEIQSTISLQNNTNDVDEDSINSKTNERGFINYDASQFVFQEGGVGRGDGQKYINQWTPEFQPQKKVNNIKVKIGEPNINGTENIINSKELCATISPANAIECDVFKWYQLSGTCWVWGSDFPYFSANTVPYEYTIDNCEFVSPEKITEMTFNEYMEYIYMSNIEPRNRKTNIQIHTSWGYPELKKIYMNYFLMSNPISNRLTIKKLEAFLSLMEVNFQDYLLQLIPATTILECQGTTYRNTLFQRQRFVYKEGINDGSEFQVSLPPDLRPPIKPVSLTPKVNDYLNSSITPITINSQVSQGIRQGIATVKIQGHINQQSVGAKIDAFTIIGEVQPGVQEITIITEP